MEADLETPKNAIEGIDSENETETETKVQKCKLPNVSECLAKYFRW